MIYMISDLVKVFLSQVIQLIENPEHYNHSWWAKDKDNKSVIWSDPTAVKFNLIGAIERIGMDQPEAKEETYSELNLILEKSKFSLNDLNNTATHTEALEFLSSILNGTTGNDR